MRPEKFFPGRIDSALPNLLQERIKDNEIQSLLVG